jgi:hypothetical protein
VSTLSAYKGSAKKKPRSAWHVCAEALDTLLLLGGIMIVMGAIILMTTHTGQIFGAALGLLMVEASAWGSTRRLMPGQRKYSALRAEVDRFLGLVKQLNNTALTKQEHSAPEAHQAFEETCEAMKQSVKQMIYVAGKTDSDLVEKALADDHITAHTEQSDNCSDAGKTQQTSDQTNVLL